MRYWIERRRVRLKPAFDMAAMTARKLGDLCADMDDLCAGTCRYCPAPCCLTAHPWYDFADLLLLNLLDQPIPSRQILVTSDAPCRYLGSCGCRRPRLQRPFVCTWYICPTQRRRASTRLLEHLNAEIQALKMLRRLMEESFLRAVQ